MATWGQVGPNGAKRGQTGPNRAKWFQTGTNGVKHRQTGPYGAKQGQTELIFCMQEYSYEMKKIMFSNPGPQTKIDRAMGILLILRF